MTDEARRLIEEEEQNAALAQTQLILGVIEAARALLSKDGHTPERCEVVNLAEKLLNNLNLTTKA